MKDPNVPSFKADNLRVGEAQGRGGLPGIWVLGGHWPGGKVPPGMLLQSLFNEFLQFADAR